MERHHLFISPKEEAQNWGIPEEDLEGFPWEQHGITLIRILRRRKTLEARIDFLRHSRGLTDRRAFLVLELGVPREILDRIHWPTQGETFLKLFKSCPTPEHAKQAIAFMHRCSDPYAGLITYRKVSLSEASLYHAMGVTTRETLRMLFSVQSRAILVQERSTDFKKGVSDVSPSVETSHTIVLVGSTAKRQKASPPAACYAESSLIPTIRRLSFSSAASSEQDKESSPPCAPPLDSHADFSLTTSIRRLSFSSEGEA